MKRMADDSDSLVFDQAVAAKRLKTSNMNSQTPKTEPDPDAIKMFVGQIPRSMDENDLRKMFEEFGPVYQLNVLRDKVTGQSKGCCFVTFYTRKAALEAQNDLHNIKTMPGMQHPIQMKPADSEKRNEERKLFIGMLSKKCNENDVRMMFAPFGQIEEVTVLREQNGQSKGCAFVTYSSRQCAQNAIKAMHHSQTMEGCRSPLVVKFADTQKDKEMKKLQQMNANLLSMANIAGLGAMGPQYLATTNRGVLTDGGLDSELLQQAAAGNVGALSNLGNLGSGLNVLQMQQVLAAASAAAAALQNNPGLAALAGLNSSSLSNSSNSSSAVATGAASTSNTNSSGDTSNLQALQNLQGLVALASLASNPGLNTLGMQNLATLNQLAAVNPQPGASIGIATPLQNGNSGNATSSTAWPNSQQDSSGEAATLLGSMTTSTTSAQSMGLTAMQSSLPSMAMATPQHSNVNGLGSSHMAAAGSQAGVDALSQAYSGIQQYAGLSGLLGQASFPNAFTTQTAAQIQQAAANSPAGKQTEGPDGANLFIYHLPQEFADHDLMQMFMPFGTVVSAKVFIDKQTNLSKCFGFVSYDNPVSAQAAIQAMNGFQIGMKRLKVQLKRPKSDAKPY